MPSFVKGQCLKPHVGSDLGKQSYSSPLWSGHPLFEERGELVDTGSSQIYTRGKVCLLCFNVLIQVVKIPVH